MSETIRIDSDEAEHVVEPYERAMPEALARFYGRWAPAGAEVLELGCGSGRDARFMAAAGARVVATDGSPEMLKRARSIAANGGSNVRFESFELPGDEADRRDPQRILDRLHEGRPFDVVTSSGVLQHLNAQALREAVRLLAALVSDAGVILVSVPTEYPGGDGRCCSNLPAAHYLDLFDEFGFAAAANETEEHAGSSETPACWARMVFLRRRDRRQAGAQLCGIVETDGKASTYKLALLHSICGVSIASPSRARFLSDDELRTLAARRAKRLGADDAETFPPLPPTAALPLYCIVERWIESYWKIYEPELMRLEAPTALALQHAAPRQLKKQMRRKDGCEAEDTPEFLEPLMRVMARYNGDWTKFRDDLYGGSILTGSETGDLLLELLTITSETIKKGPVYYSGNSLDGSAGVVQSLKGNRIFSVGKSAGTFDTLSSGEPLVPARLALRWGELRLPAALWSELRAAAPWISDAAALRWAQCSERLSKEDNRAGTLNDVLSRLLREPAERDTAAARKAYLAAIESRHLMHCVWSGKALTAKTLAVDHAIPWAKSRSNDLWNLLPADKQTNGSKSDALPSTDLLYERRHAVMDAWRILAGPYRELFFAQAEASLAVALGGGSGNWEGPLFDALLDAVDRTARRFSAARWNPKAA